jgi:hypothetical protein
MDGLETRVKNGSQPFLGVRGRLTRETGRLKSPATPFPDQGDEPAFALLGPTAENSFHVQGFSGTTGEDKIEMFQGIIAGEKTPKKALDARTILFGDQFQEGGQTIQLGVGISAQDLKSLVGVNNTGKIKYKNPLAHVADGLEEKVIE